MWFGFYLVFLDLLSRADRVLKRVQKKIEIDFIPVIYNLEFNTFKLTEKIFSDMISIFSFSFLLFIWYLCIERSFQHSFATRIVRLPSHYSTHWSTGQNKYLSRKYKSYLSYLFFTSTGFFLLTQDYMLYFFLHPIFIWFVFGFFFRSDCFDQLSTLRVYIAPCSTNSLVLSTKRYHVTLHDRKWTAFSDKRALNFAFGLF